MKEIKLPAHVEEMIDELAGLRLEEELILRKEPPPLSYEMTVEEVRRLRAQTQHHQRTAKAGSYTLAEKYGVADLLPLASNGTASTTNRHSRRRRSRTAI